MLLAAIKVYTVNGMILIHYDGADLPGLLPVPEWALGQWTPTEESNRLLYEYCICIKCK
jgi:hypothetical protein